MRQVFLNQHWRGERVPFRNSEKGCLFGVHFGWFTMFLPGSNKSNLLEVLENNMNWHINDTRITPGRLTAGI